MALGVPLSEVTAAGWVGRTTQAECEAKGAAAAWRGPATPPGSIGTCTAPDDERDPGDLDCWATPRPEGCDDPNALEGKTSTESDTTAASVVGALGAIGTTAATILGAVAAWQTRERTADREDQRLVLQREAAQLDRQSREAIAALQQAGTAEANRIAADLQRAMFDRQAALSGETTKLVLIGGVVVLGLAVAGTVVYFATRPNKNPSRGRRIYRGRK